MWKRIILFVTVIILGEEILGEKIGCEKGCYVVLNEVGWFGSLEKSEIVEFGW